MAARLLHGASWNVAAQLTPVVINLVLTPYLIHGLGIDQYGLYALAATITIFLSSFDGGIGPTAQRFFSLYAGRDDRRTTTRLLCTLIAVIVVAGGIVSTADWILSPLIATAFHMPRRYRPESVFLLRTFGVLMTISLLHNLFVALLQARQRFGLTSKATIASYMAWAVGLYFTIQGHHGLRGIALALVGEQVLATLVIVPSALRYLQWRAIRFVPRRDLKHFFGYAARAQTMGIAALVNMEFDALIIGAVLPVRNVGLYNAGANVSTQLRYVATSVLPPVSSQLANTFGRDGEPNTLREMARLQRLWVVATSGWCSAGLGAVYFGIVAWLGQSFRVSAMVCLILLAGHAVNLLTGITTCYA
ncbi:MAG: oligosaccharide flippase family protein, partial [Pseudonocardiaceae bacterium]